MFFEKKSFEDILEENEKKIKEIEIQIDSVNLEMKKVFKGLDMSENKLSEYLGNPENFSKEMWNRLQDERKNLEERLQKKFDNIRDPLQAKERYAQRNLPSYAIFCK